MCGVRKYRLERGKAIVDSRDLRFRERFPVEVFAFDSLVFASFIDRQTCQLGQTRVLPCFPTVWLHGSVCSALHRHRAWVRIPLKRPEFVSREFKIYDGDGRRKRHLKI